MASSAHAPSKRITVSLRRGMVAVAIAAVGAVAATGPAGAAVSWDPSCPHGCTRAPAADGTSNTMIAGFAPTPPRPSEGIIGILIGL